MSDIVNKKHLGIVIVGHVDAGKSTTTGHLLFELGGIDARTMQKLKEEAEHLGKSSFSYAFFMDKHKEERARGVTISCTTKEFFTDNYHYTIIDAPGHRDFIKNMISGASQADIALLMVPASKGSFEVSVQKGNHKTGQVQGQTRQHAKLCNLLGIEQLIVGINKMDAADYSEERFNEIKSNVELMLKNIGYKTKKIPFIPMSGFNGENLTRVSDKMPWYKGFEVPVSKGVKVKGHTLVDALNIVAQVPERPENVPFRLPVSDVLKIPGAGDIITGRVEQGTIKAGDVVKFLPSGIEGKVFSIEMHHRPIAVAHAGDNIGINMKGLDKTNMPSSGDIMVLKNDQHSKNNEALSVKSFRAMVYVQDHPGELKAGDANGRGGFTPSIHVRTSKAPCRLAKIHWKQGKATGGVKLDNPLFIKAGEQAEVSFEPRTPFFVDKFDDCRGLGRIAGMDSNTLVVLGKVLEVEYN